MSTNYEDMDVEESLKRARQRVARACVQCKKSHTACDDYRPCHRCIHLGKGESCRDAEVKRRGRPPKKRKRSDSEESTSDLKHEKRPFTEQHFSSFYAFQLPTPNSSGSEDPCSSDSTPPPSSPRARSTASPSAKRSYDTNCQHSEESSLPYNGAGKSVPDLHNMFAHVVQEMRGIKQVARDLIVEQQALRQTVKQLTRQQQQYNNRPAEPTIVYKTIETDTMSEFISIIKNEKTKNQFRDKILLYKSLNKPFALMKNCQPTIPITAIILTASQSFCDVFGYSLGEIIGIPHQVIISANTEDECRAKVSIGFAGMGLVSNVVQLTPQLKTKDGTTLHSRTTIQMFVDNTNWLSIMTVEWFAPVVLSLGYEVSENIVSRGGDAQLTDEEGILVKVDRNCIVNDLNLVGKS